MVPAIFCQGGSLRALEPAWASPNRLKDPLCAPQRLPNGRSRARLRPAVILPTSLLSNFPPAASPRAPPARSCAVTYPTSTAHGILWAWLEPGDAGSAAAAASPLPSVPSLDAHGAPWGPVATWYVRDMAVDYVALMENSADPSHVHFTHAGELRCVEFRI